MPSREDWQRRLGPLYGGAVALVHSSSWRGAPHVPGHARAAGGGGARGVPVGLAAYLGAIVLRALHLPVMVAAVVGLAVLSLASAALVERGVADRIDHRDGRDQLDSPSVAAILTLVFTVLVRAAAIWSV